MAGTDHVAYKPSTFICYAVSDTNPWYLSGLTYILLHDCSVPFLTPGFFRSRQKRLGKFCKFGTNYLSVENNLLVSLKHTTCQPVTQTLWPPLNPNKKCLKSVISLYHIWTMCVGVHIDRGEWQFYRKLVCACRGLVGFSYKRSALNIFFRKMLYKYLLLMSGGKF